MQFDQVLSPASPEAHAISHLFVYMLVIAALILAVVAGLVVYIIIRFRGRPGDAEPRQISGNRTLEIVWTAIPLAIVTSLVVFTIYTMRVVDPGAGQRKPDLVIIAHQWWWEVHYPHSGVVTANEVHMPVGRHWLVRVESADVIHDFWVPRLGRKIDAIPGHPNHIWLQVDAPDTYLGSCAEYCGAGHAWMRIRVIAQTPEAFAAWEKQQLATPPPPTAEEAVAGEKLFLDRTCANCHTIAGTAAKGAIGPDLTHLADRETLAAGALTNTPDNLATWLRNPDAVKPGANMPNLDLSAGQIKELVAYLEGLK